MASKKFDKGSEEWEMFSSFWKICQRFWEPEDNDEYWDQVTKSIDEFCEKHKKDNEIFAKEITFALAATLDKKYKNKIK